MRGRPVAAREILIAASTASVPVLAGTIAPTDPGARPSSCSASTPFSSVTPSCGRLPLRAAPSRAAEPVARAPRLSDVRAPHSNPTLDGVLPQTYFLPFLALILAFAFLAFGQPVTVIFVLWATCAPFCPTIVVGIVNG